MQGSAIHDAYAIATPSQRLAAAHHQKRRARLAANAKTDTPINLRAKPLPPKKPEPVPVFSMADWIERQKQIPLPASVTQGPVSIKAIQIACAKHFDISLEAILSCSRRDHHVLPRHVGMFLARELCAYSFLKIGRLFGQRDHATVIFSVRKIERMSAHDKKVAKDIAAIKLALGASA